MAVNDVILNEAFGDRVKHRQLDRYYTVSVPIGGGDRVFIFKDQEKAHTIPLEDIPRELIETQDGDGRTDPDQDNQQLLSLRVKLDNQYWREGVWIPCLQARLKLGR